MKSIKGIILAGGTGSRLYPLTLGTSKQLLPVYDKPMIYYPLSVFMQAEIKDVLIISSEHDLPKFKKLLGDGSNLGINISYKVQSKPNGIAESFIIGEEFIGEENVCLILGDNIFHGEGFISKINNAKKVLSNGFSSIFGVSVQYPKNFGVIEFDENKNVINIFEKPENPKSNFIVSGLYFYTNDVIQIAKNVKASKRGEYEITSINQFYLKQNNLKVQLLGRGFSWLDTGTHDTLLEAGRFIESIEKRKGLKVSCLEEIAYRMNYINADQVRKLAIPLRKNDYGKYLLNLVKDS